MAWDGLYALCSAGTSFNMLFNHANVLRMPGRSREPGGTLMVYGGANLARRAFAKTDEQVENDFVEDLYRLFPDARGVVDEVVVQRWEDAIPSAFPGRAALQPAIERGVPPIFFAGDYAGEWTHMESAAETGAEAAEKALQVLVAEPARAATA